MLGSEGTQAADHPFWRGVNQRLNAERYRLFTGALADHNVSIRDYRLQHLMKTLNNMGMITAVDHSLIQLPTPGEAIIVLGGFAELIIEQIKHVDGVSWIILGASIGVCGSSLIQPSRAKPSQPDFSLIPALNWINAPIQPYYDQLSSDLRDHVSQLAPGPLLGVDQHTSVRIDYGGAVVLGAGRVTYAGEQFEAGQMLPNKLIAI